MIQQSDDGTNVCRDNQPDGTLRTVADLARRYVAGGISIIPIAVDGSKAPAARLLPKELNPDTGVYKPTWKPLQSALPTEAELTSWFDVSNPPGLAAVCGAVSGGLECLDFDANPEPTFSGWFQFVDAADPDLGKRVAVVRTAGGGYHVWFRCETRPVAGNMVLASDPTRVNGDQRLIETRGEGGYALLPGCPAQCHTSGNLYKQLEGPPLWELKPISSDERDTLLSAARAMDRTPPSLPKPPAPRAPGEALRPGDDFDSRIDVLDLLVQAGWTVWNDQGEVTYLTRPGKKVGVSASVGKVKGTDGTRLAHIFTSNAEGLEAGKNYGPFNLYAALHHRGDHAAAARELAAQGYGTPTHSGHALISAGGLDTTRPATPSQLLSPIEALEVPEPHPWPTIGDEAYHGVAGEIVKRIEPETESDPVAVLVQLLVAVGNALGRGPYIPVESDRHFPNLFAVVVGNSAAARKGTSWNRVLDVMAKADSNWAEERVVQGLTSGEGLMHHVRDSRKDDEGVQDKRLMVEETEFATVLKRMTQKENTLSAVLRQAWQSGKLSTLSKVSPVKATGAHISVIGHITQPELLRYLSQTEMLNGFANRFLWVCARHSKRLPFGGKPVDISDLLPKLQRAIMHNRNDLPVTRTPDADQLWCELYTQELAEAKGDSLYVGVVARAAPQTLRLSMLYALLDGSEVVDVDHLKAGLAVWRYCDASARRLFSDVLDNALAAQIQSFLQSSPDGLSKTELHRAFGNREGAKDIIAALALLLAKGLAVRGRQTQPGPGRPTERWYATEHQRKK